MVATPAQRETLSRALQALANKRSGHFEDILWLAYGDEWTLILQALTRRGVVRYSNSEDEHAITDEGRRVLGVLREAGHGVDREAAGRAGAR